MHFYPRLRDLREDHDLRQKDIADHLHLVQQQYASYEIGKFEIPFHYVITLARFYNVSVDYIAGLIDDPRPLYPSKSGAGGKSTSVTVHGNINNAGKININNNSGKINIKG